MAKDRSLDYYEILESDRNASQEELKKNYQRLILCTHPDKLASESDRFHLIQTAWTVLRHAESRRLYDAELSCKEHSELLLYDTISLNDMDQVSEGVYSYSCRCGGTYVLETDGKHAGKLVIGCDECSFSIEVNL